MSFDLAVRPEPAVVTAEEAARKYEKFAERESGAVPADSSQWSANPSLIGEAVLVSMSLSTPERGDHYVQAGFGEQVAARPGCFALEHREGQPDRHFRVEVADGARVVQAFIGFATGDDTWRQAFDWQRMEF